MAPSIKIRPATAAAVVMRWLPGSHEEWVEQRLEAEAAEASERRRQAHAQALRNERDGVLQRLGGIVGVADEQRVEVAYVPPHEWPTVGERRAQLQVRLAAIDDELARASG